MKVSWNNLDQYIKENQKPDLCGHRTSRKQAADFKKEGNLLDDKLKLLTYTELYSDDPKDVFIGSYPYYDCDVFVCRKCGFIMLFYLDQGGAVPRPEYISTDASMYYLPEPAVKRVTVPYKYLDWMLDFPGLREELEKVDKSEKYQLRQKIDKERELRICNYSDHGTGENRSISFDVIGERELLYKIAKWNDEANKLGEND